MPVCNKCTSRDCHNTAFASSLHACVCVSVLCLRLRKYEACEFVHRGKSKHTRSALVSVLAFACVSESAALEGEAGKGGVRAR